MNKRIIPENHRPSREQGVSIVEVMMAMVAGLMLMAGVGQVFTSSKQTYRIQDARARLQENARFAMDIMIRSLRDAGYMGCSNSIPLPTPYPLGRGDKDFSYVYAYGVVAGDPATDKRLNTIRAVQGFEWNGGTSDDVDVDNWTPDRDSNIPSHNIRSGSDILTVRGPTDASLRLTATMAAANSVLTVGTNGLSKCDVVIVSDCTSDPPTASVMRITNNRPESGTLRHVSTGRCTPDNASASLDKAYPAGSEVLPYATTSYFVRDNSDDSSAEPALYRRINSNNSEELVEGVESMQILYGADNDALPAVPVGQAPARSQYPNYSPDFYVSAANVADWRRVVSVRVSLLMRTREDNLASTAQTFPFNGAEFPSAGHPDRRLRQVFTTTISIRNRLP